MLNHTRVTPSMNVDITVRMPMIAPTAITSASPAPRSVPLATVPAGVLRYLGDIPQTRGARADDAPYADRGELPQPQGPVEPDSLAALRLLDVLDGFAAENSLACPEPGHHPHHFTFGNG
jgi:hypothetical protein